jgi:hypothetical protein
MKKLAIYSYGISERLSPQRHPDQRFDPDFLIAGFLLAGSLKSGAT